MLGVIHQLEKNVRHAPNRLKRSHVVYRFPHTKVRLFVKLVQILQDGGAHKQVFMVKGDGGHKFCTACRNLYTRASGVVDEAGDPLLSCSLILPETLDFATDADVRGTVRRLAHFASTRDPGDVKLMETACGFNHNRFNLLLDPALEHILNPVSNFAHDWMHTFVVHGVWNVVTYLLVAALVAHRRTGGTRQVLSDISEYIGLWVAPRRLGCSTKQLQDIFSPNRWKSSNTAKYLKCTASEALTLASILACFVQNVYLRADICAPECQAYLGCVDIIDLLMAVPHGLITSGALELAVCSFLKACLEAGWNDYLTPKFHWTIHLYKELSLFKTLVACFVHERKHKMVKRFTGDHKNTANYEKSVLAEITCQHLHDLVADDKCCYDARLVEPTVQCREPAAGKLRAVSGLPHGSPIRTARRARVSEFEVCAVRDVVIAKENGDTVVNEVWFFFASGTVLLAVVARWPFVSQNAEQGTITVTCTDADVKCVPVADIVTSCSHRRKADGTALIIVPVLHRGGPFR